MNGLTPDLSHWLGVILPYAVIATAFWRLAAGAVKDAVSVGLAPARFYPLPRRVARGPLRGLTLPTVPVGYGSGFFAVAFIYACSNDRAHTMPGAETDVYRWALIVLAWISMLGLIAFTGWLRRATRRLLSDAAGKQSAEGERDEAHLQVQAARETIEAVVPLWPGPAGASLFDPGADPVGNADGGRFVVVSDVGAAILGYSPDELAGTTYTAFLAPGERERIAELFAAIGRGEVSPHHPVRVDYEMGHRHPLPGSVRTIEWSPPSMTRVDLPGGLTLSTFRDVTDEIEKAQAQEKRLELEVLDARIRARSEALGTK